MSNNFNKEIIKRIEKARYENNLSQREMANALGINQRTYEKLISGETTKLNSDYIKKVWDKFHIWAIDLDSIGIDSDMVVALNDLTPDQYYHIKSIISDIVNSNSIRRKSRR